MDSLGTGIEGDLGLNLKVQIGIEWERSDHTIGSWKYPSLDCFKKGRKKNIYPTKPLVDLECSPASCVLLGTPFSGAPATTGWHLDPVLVDWAMAILPTIPASCPLVSPCPFPTPIGREASKSATARAPPLVIRFQILPLPAACTVSFVIGHGVSTAQCPCP